MFERICPRTHDTNGQGRTHRGSDMRGELCILKSAVGGVSVVRTVGNFEVVRANLASIPAASSRPLRRSRFEGLSAAEWTSALQAREDARVSAASLGTDVDRLARMCSIQGRTLRPVHAPPPSLSLRRHPHRPSIEALVLSTVDANATAMWDLDLP